ncbi:MAG: molecular chaperone GrpE [Parcubacteria group bacterium Gr01-1014_38]|nr:MAG: molecular chaperone GrpE [Parcubacteria group bacterium Gr01-1014_38]
MPAPLRGLPAGTVHRTNTDPRLAAAEAAASEHLAGWQRALADYENLRKDLEDRLAHASDAAQDSVLKDLISLLDYFEAAMRHTPEELKSHPWTTGIVQIYQAFRSFLQEAGVTATGEVGSPFDPKLHEAVAEEPSHLSAGTITEVLAAGYLRNGQVLRAARVKVSKSSET